MASLFAGTPQAAPSYAATTTDVPKWLQDYTVDLFSQQRAVSGTPYQPYALPRIAQTTAPTTQSQNLIESNIGAYQPAVSGAIQGTQALATQGAGTASGLGMMQQAAGMSGINAAQPYLNNAGQSSVSNINSYMNPYTQNVTDQIAKLGARNLSENLLPAVSDQFVRAGQFGSSGMGTFGERALRDTQESVLNQQNQALQSGYGQALSTSQADLARQAQLGQTAGNLTQAGQQNLATIGAQTAAASGADLTRQQSAEAQAADLAKMQQGLTTADAAALGSVGTAQQQQNQLGLDVAYQDYQNQIAYPQTMINNMSTTLRGLPPAAVPTTGTTSGYATTFAPSPLSTIAGAYGTIQGLSKGLARGGVVGYADGGAVSSTDNLEQSVMKDYGQYFSRGYAEGGTAAYDARMAQIQPAYDQNNAAMANRGAYYDAHPAIASPDSATAINNNYKDMTNQYNTAIAAYNKNNNVDLETPKTAYYNALDKYLMSNSRGVNPAVYNGLTSARDTKANDYASAEADLQAQIDNGDAYSGDTPYYGSADAAYRTQLDNLSNTISKPAGRSAWGTAIPHLAHGGRVPRYAQAGEVDTQDAETYPLQPEAPVQGYSTPPAPRTNAGVMSQLNPELAALMKMYNVGNVDYSADLAKTRQAIADERTNYNTAIDKLAQTGVATGPSESEKWFSRAAAFLDPGKTGSFGEGVQHFAVQEAANRAEQRKANALNATNAAQYGLKKHELNLESLRDEGKTLQSLQGEQSKGRLELIKESIKEAIAAGKKPPEWAVYELYREQETAAGRTPLDWEPYRLAGKKAGATNIVMPDTKGETKYDEALGAKLADRDAALMDVADNIPKQLETAGNIKTLLKQHPITGAGAESLLALNNVLATAGLIDPKRGITTETLVAQLSGQTLAAIKASGLGAGQGFTDKDLKFLAGATSGTIEMNAGSLAKLADLTERAARHSADRYNKFVDRTTPQKREFYGIHKLELTPSVNVPTPYFEEHK